MDSCLKKAITLVDSVKAVNAVIDEQACISCGLCVKVCQKDELPEMKEPIAWQQGWAADAEIAAAAFTEALMLRR